MVQKLEIDVNVSKDLSKYKSGTVLIKNGSVFEIVTREELLAPFTAEIDRLKAVIADMEKSNTEFRDSMNKSNSEFQIGINNKMNEFLAQYKKTNATVIEMVKSVVEHQGE